MSIIICNAIQSARNIELPIVVEGCTVSVALVDYLTSGLNDLFMSRQWLIEHGLKNAAIEMGERIELICPEGESRLVTKIDNKAPSWDNFVKTVITVNNLEDKELFRYEEEYILIPNQCANEVLDLASSQFSGDFAALLSFNRFFIFATLKNPISYIGKNVFISGCGTGSESLVCKLLGAQSCVGHDTDKSAINFARIRFGSLNEISFTSEIPQNKSEFDLVISRHVLEHIPRPEWLKYFEDLAGLLKHDGEILIDVPNQNNPLEPHTEILFFHLLSNEVKHKIVEYAAVTNPAWYMPLKEKLSALINHRNILLSEIKLSLPHDLVVTSAMFIDMNCENYDEDMADLIRIVLIKKEKKDS